MNSKSRQGWSILLVVLLVGLNLILFNALLGKKRIFRWDFTEGGHFSLTEPTRDMLANLEEPADLRFYFSEPTSQHEKLRPLVRPLADLLKEFESSSKGRVRTHLHEITEGSQAVVADAENNFSVRPIKVRISGVFEAGVRDNYFSLVVQLGTRHAHFSLDENFDQLLRIEQKPNDPVGISVELADIENTVVRALRKLARDFGSVPGALVARDKTAKVKVFLSKAEDLPKDLEKTKEAIEKITTRFNKESQGRLPTEIIDPLEGVPAEERRKVISKLEKDYKIRPIPKDLFGEKVFYAYATIDLDGNRDQFELFSEEGTAFGESDLRTRLEGSLQRLIPGYLPGVALSYPAPEMNPMMMQMGQRPPPSEFAYLPKALESEFETSEVTLGAKAIIPSNVGTLGMVAPPDLTDEALYSLDQFILRGGRLVVCVDPFSFDAEQSQVQGGFQIKTNRHEKLIAFLKHYGIEVTPKLLQDTRSEYLPIRGKVRYVGGMPVQEVRQVEYPFFMRITKDGFSKDSPITASLEAGAMLWASPVELAEKLPEGVTGQVLVRTSPEASATDSTATVDTVIDVGYRPPSDARAYGLAAQVRGKFKSYFTDKPIPGLDKFRDPEAPKPEGAPEAPPKPEGATEAKGGVLLESLRPGSLVVVGDSEWLSPRVLDMCGQEQTLLMENLRCFVNALDPSDETDAAVQIRNRAPLVRPLTALAGKSEHERELSGTTSFIIVTVVSILALLSVGFVWMMLRKTRSAMTLDN